MELLVGNVRKRVFICTFYDWLPYYNAISVHARNGYRLNTTYFNRVNANTVV